MIYLDVWQGCEYAFELFSKSQEMLKNYLIKLRLAQNGDIYRNADS